MKKRQQRESALPFYRKQLLGFLPPRAPWDEGEITDFLRDRCESQPTERSKISQPNRFHQH